MEKTDSFWLMDEGAKGVTDEQVKKAEQQLGVTLPATFISLLKVQNGGYITNEVFPTDFPTSWADDHINVSDIYGIESDYSILNSAYLIKEWDLPDDIVLISGSGHIWIALDYRGRTENPPVILIDEDGAGIETLAADFETFINCLKADEPLDLDEEDDSIFSDDPDEEMEFYESDGPIDWVDYVLYEASQFNEETQKSIAEEIRKGRTNAEIKIEIDKIVKSDKPNKIDDGFFDVLQLYDGELEAYMIDQIIDHPKTKVREAVANHLAACAIRGENPLASEKVQMYLNQMIVKERNEHIRYVIETGIEKLNEHASSKDEQ